MPRLGKGIDYKSQSMKKRMMVMRTPIVEQCIGCDKIDIKEGIEPSSQDFCTSYINPASIWSRGDCPLASHLEVEDKPKEKVRVGQQKQIKIKK